MTRALVVDDEPSILRAMRINLSARGYDVTTTPDGAAALAAAARDRPEVIILDLGLPDMDGTDVIHGIRGWTSTPVIVLSASGEEARKVAALDAGADDYVTKPFGMGELLARLRAAIRRAACTMASGEPGSLVGPGGTIEFLEQAVDARNYLAHHFPREYFMVAPSERVREQATDQLAHMSAQLDDLEEALEAHLRSLGVAGIDELDEEARAEIEKLRPKDWWLGEPPEQDNADDNRG